MNWVSFQICEAELLWASCIGAPKPSIAGGITDKPDGLRVELCAQEFFVEHDAPWALGDHSLKLVKRDLSEVHGAIVVPQVAVRLPCSEGLAPRSCPS